MLEVGGGGVFSTSGDTMITLGDIMSTSGDVQYIRVYYDARDIMINVEGYHDYIGGCSVH